MPLWIQLVLCIVLCYAVWGGFQLLYLRGINYVQCYWVTAVYFAAAGGITAALFWHWLNPLLAHPVPTALWSVVFFMCAQLVLCIWLPRVLSRPTHYLQTHPHRYYLDINWRRLVSKSADIATQQVFIAVLVVLLWTMGLSLVQLIFAFVVLFAVLPLPLLVLEWGHWPAWAFGGAVVVFSLLFPPLILLVHYGFVYTYIIHWLFYTALSIGFWLKHS